MIKKKYHTEVQQLIDADALNTTVDSNDFIDFLCYCVERLNRGKLVQAIWSDYQEKAD